MEDRKFLRKDHGENMTQGEKPPKWACILFFSGLLIAIMLFSGPGCGAQWMLYYDKSISGYVVDAETKKPLEGALVIGMWQLSGFMSQGFDGYANVLVEKTDNKGDFKIPCWITFKPWKVGSAVHELAPKIVIYKPGYRTYWSHKMMREGFTADISKPKGEKRQLKEEYSITPAKLSKIYADEQIWESHMEFRAETHYPSYFSKNQLRNIFTILEGASSEMPPANVRAKQQILKDIEEDRRYWVEGRR